MRIHEVDLRDDARELDVFVQRKVAEPVVGMSGRHGHETCRQQATKTTVRTMLSLRMLIHAGSPKVGVSMAHYPRRALHRR
jgi:hypothetical protein